MPYYINFVCDGAGCDVIQQFEFSDNTETFETLLSFAKEAGDWSIELKSSEVKEPLRSSNRIFNCPKCLGKISE